MPDLPDRTQRPEGDATDGTSENLAALDDAEQQHYPQDDEPTPTRYELRFEASGSVGQGTAPEPPTPQGETP